MRYRRMAQVLATRWELSRGVVSCPEVSRSVVRCPHMSQWCATSCRGLLRTPRDLLATIRRSLVRPREAPRGVSQ